MPEKQEDFCRFEAAEDLSHISDVLRRTRKVLKTKEYARLSDLSNETIHSATINQDPVNIVVAVLLYSLYKIFLRKHYQNMPGWETFHAVLLENLDGMLVAASSGDCPRFLEHAGLIRESLNTLDGNLASYIKDVFYKAEINKGYRLYEHGLSSQKIASLLGVSLWDFASYVGQTQMHEGNAAITMPEKTRVKLLEDFFS